MGRWTWKCSRCKAEEDRIVPLRERDLPYACEQCGGPTERLFAVEAARGFMSFEPHYDEGLGCDVHSFGEKKRIMQDLGVHEAGDPQGGARNFDSKAPFKIGRGKPRGERYVSRQSIPEVPTPIGVVKGEETQWTRSDQLKTV